MYFHKTVNACSASGMSGFNDYYCGNYAESNAVGVSNEEHYVALDLGRSLVELAQLKGWQGGGLEMLIGLECNSDNPNQARHHKYTMHSGHIWGRILNNDFAGVFGEWTIGKWSKGLGDTGSQMRTLQWALFPTVTWKKAFDNLYGTRDNASPRLKMLIEIVKSGYDEGERWS